jgi:hypothetical protein
VNPNPASASCPFYILLLCAFFRQNMPPCMTWRDTSPALTSSLVRQGLFATLQVDASAGTSTCPLLHVTSVNTLSPHLMLQSAMRRSVTCPSPRPWGPLAFLPYTSARHFFFKVGGVMCSYNALYGKPACGSPELLTQYLRSELGWLGHVVSDCTAIELMQVRTCGSCVNVRARIHENPHRPIATLLQDAKYDSCAPPYPPTACNPDYFPGHNFTRTAVETANAALSAGTDLNCGPFYHMWLAPPGGLAANGSVSASLVAGASDDVIVVSYSANYASA